MKTKYLFYALVCIMSVGQIKAADLYVRDLGAGGAYSTISAAITAANNGDRIIIKPKIGNVPYLENVTINKSLTLVSETNFSKYYVQGNISIVPAVGRVVNIHNMYAFQSSIATTSTTLVGGRCTVNIVNCTADNNIDMASTQSVTANVHGSSSLNLFFLHGKITGNNCLFVTLYNDAAPFATSPVYIAGNKAYQVKSNTTSYPINILNNDINHGNGNPVIIGALEIGSTNTIQNNRITSSSFTPLYVSVSSTSTGNIVVINNILNSSAVNKIDVNAAAPTVIATNNLSSTNFNTSNVDIQSNNISSASYNLDLDLQTSSGAIINAGLPDEEYQDLDLTRNDIGPLGGSNSWANYWPSNAGNKPRVMFLNTPRRVYLGTTSIQAEATGISK